MIGLRRRASIHNLRQRIAALSRLRLKDVDLEFLKERLNLLFQGYKQQTPILGVGEVFFRGVRRGQRPTNISQLSYPPAGKVQTYGRANRPGQPAFYASTARAAVFFECRVQPGDYIAVGRWRLTNRMFANSVGFSDAVFRKWRSARDKLPPWEQVNFSFAKANQVVHQFFAEMFARDISSEANHEYKLSVALAEKLMGPIEGGEPHAIADKRIGAVIYPALAMRANTDNVVFLPDFVDRYLILESVEYICVEEIVGDFQYRISVRDFADSFAADGSIDWKSDHVDLQLEPQSTVSAGVENGKWVVRDQSGGLLKEV